jgi:hypothetical protein
LQSDVDFRRNRLVAQDAGLPGILRSSFLANAAGCLVASGSDMSIACQEKLICRLMPQVQA